MPGILHRILVTLLVHVLGVVLLMCDAQADSGRATLSVRLNADLADGTLDHFSLLEAALIAGGIDQPAEFESFAAKFLSMCERNAPTILATEKEETKDRLNALLACLHEQFLTGEYQLDYSELHRTLSEGHFNCVTSTILFRALCERFHVASSAAASPRHLMGWLPGSPGIPVETTCRTWKVGALLTDSAEKLSQFPGEFREITDVELLGKVYYNLGVAELEANRYSAAVGSLRQAHQLDPRDTAAHDNLLAAFNNWALAECDAERFEAATQLIVQGLLIDAHHLPLLANDLHVHQKWVQQLCLHGDFQKAVWVLQQGHERRPNVKLFGDGQAAIYGRWAQGQLTRGEFDAAWNILEQGSALLGPNQQSQWQLAVISAAHALLMREQQSPLARELLERAAARYPKHRAELDRLQGKEGLVTTKDTNGESED